MSGARKITARRYPITARANNTADQTGGYDTSFFPEATWSVEIKMHPARYFPHRPVSAALRGAGRGADIKEKVQQPLALLRYGYPELRDMSKPIGVATHRLTEALPAEMQESLPSIEELKKELGYGG